MFKKKYNAAKEEYNALFGFDARGRPQQRYVWEGVGDGPPTPSDLDDGAWLWLMDVGSETGRSQPGEIVAVLRRRYGKWVADGIRGDVHDNENTVIADDSEPYEVAVKTAYAMYILRKGE